MYKIIILLFMAALIIFFLNKFLLRNNVLIYNNKISKHKDNYKSKILLSGGLGALLYLTIYHILFSFDKEFLHIIFFSLPFLFLGFFSDANAIKRASFRLYMMIVFCALPIYFLELNISIIDIDFLKYFLSNIYFSIFFVTLCLVIVVNGSNFIDGRHGNLSLFLLTSLISIIFLTQQKVIYLSYSSDLYAIVAFLFIFTLFNFNEKSFFGDNGAYFLGSIIGLIAIDIYLKNKNLSSYYVANLLIYPAYEVFVSVLRRSLSKKSTLQPDKHHLHNLIFIFLNSNLGIKSRIINVLTSILIFISNASFIFFSSSKPENKKYQLELLFTYILTYSIIYLILRFVVSKYKNNYKVI